MLAEKTRTVSPWIWTLTFLKRWRSSLFMALAFSSGMPWAMGARWRTVPPSASSTLPYWRALSGTLRRTSFSSSTSTTCLSLPSLSETSTSASPSSVTELTLFLKS